MNRHALRSKFLLGWMLVATYALADEPEAKPKVVTPDFTQLTVTIEPFGSSYNNQIEQLRIESTGKCWYKVEGWAETAKIPARNGAVFDHQLSQDRIRRLNKLLQETKWLTSEGATGEALQLHANTIKITLKRAGKELTIVCKGQRPEPYAALLHELQGIATQERRIYLHDYLPRPIGSDAWQEIGRELSALRGEPYSKSLFEIEYDRYLPIARRIIHNFHGEPDEELVPAIRLVAYLQTKSELKFLHQMANDRSSTIRFEIAKALGKLHDPESLPILVGMVSAAGTRREIGFELIQWGRDSVPAILKLIEQSTDARLDERERTIGEDMIRAYLDHWKQIEQPIDSDVIAAVRTALEAKDPMNGLIRTTYHVEFLKQLPNK